MNDLNKTVCVIGLGYIGLPTASILANSGYKVIGVDINQSTVNTINEGDIHIVEPDLKNYVKKSVMNGSLKAFTEPQAADIYMICVPTPFYKDSVVPTPNIEFVESAAKSIKNLIKEGDMIILESTSPVGTTRIVRDIIQETTKNIEKISIAYCPERVLPGKIMHELVNNDRIVGGVNKQSTDDVSRFYKTFVNGKVFSTSDKTAEMCKLAENSFRDINIAYANELSMICDENEIDVWELISLANRHPRVDILQPGTGVGGHCIAVDPWFIVSNNPNYSQIIKKAREINDSKPQWVVDKIMLEVKKISKKFDYRPKVSCLGLSFKPDIDDLRESPAVFVVQRLLEYDVNVVSVEPNIDEHNEFKLSSFDDALDADLIVILVKHQEFLNEENKEKLTNKNVLDFCGALVIS
jgi:UDP-N-acetyl-D-mannosaminuronic acid dehydrogenase